MPRLLQRRQAQSLFLAHPGTKILDVRLEWSQIDLVNRRAWIRPDQAKARKPIGVPLNDDAVPTIRCWTGRHEHVLRHAVLAPDHLAEHANKVTIWEQPDAGNAQTLEA